MLGFTALILASVVGHDGPDPVAAWEFAPKYVRDGVLRARLGADAKVTGAPKASPTPLGDCLALDGKQDGFELAGSFTDQRTPWPKERLTVEAWAAVNTPEGFGGFLSVLQDNGNAERGFVLGYTGDRFAFGLATHGADDGDGKMTYLKAKRPYENGRMYHVVGTYDGKTMRLYVNGKLESTSTEQRGPILYPAKAPVGLGAYRDDEEHVRLHGRLSRVALYDLTATPDGIEHLYEHRQALAEAQPVIDEPAEFTSVVEPYLQHPSATEMTVMWETSRVASSTVYFGPSKGQLKAVSAEPGRIHSVRLTGLRPESHYVYRTESVDAAGKKLESPLLTFRTAPASEDRAVRFTIVGDTQDQPAVNRRIAEHMWNERPDYFVIVGDLVGTGANKVHWTDHFFGSMRPLLSRVPLIPVIGNHEGDARLYYDYMNVPAPEYWYRFTYGPVEWFIVDSNREVGPGSEQYQWLEKALASSKARWKFVAHHHPPFSSDEDDYGNLWEGQSTRGDLRLRPMTALYEKYGVDIVWNGHIHSYERTWPVAKGQASERGPIYIVCGGGGGGLETHGPTRPEFSSRVRHGHHYCVVSIHQNRFEMRAFDIEGRQFDSLILQK
ncbi:MAG: metallophosphoesterase [Fimbriimonadaceae bacterium]|nr:metallophosphoesterase [Fimbriimonadaceae bacterium]